MTFGSLLSPTALFEARDSWRKNIFTSVISQKFWESGNEVHSPYNAELVRNDYINKFPSYKQLRSRKSCENELLQSRLLYEILMKLHLKLQQVIEKNDANKPKALKSTK